MCREYDSKRLLKAHALRLCGLDLPIQVAQYKLGDDFDAVVAANPWMKETKLVVKPDCLFGKRGKNDLVGLNLDVPGARSFVEARAGKVIRMGPAEGKIDTFVIEPFVPHAEEYYLSLGTVREGTVVRFSDAGGVEIEENWDRVKDVVVPTGAKATPERLAPLLATLPVETRDNVAAFIGAAFDVYEAIDMTLLEMNPFTIDPRSGKPFPLDMRGELDDSAAFRSQKLWLGAEFPRPFGRSDLPQEAKVKAMDEATGASLKLSILNPAGRVWTMVAGGGASVIYADTVGDLGAAGELGNYAEYSGGPNADETYRYAKVLLAAATANPDGRARALIVGGGIANFTDVAATFKGIIRALIEAKDDLIAAHMRIFVRRGGPNYKLGLQQMRDAGDKVGVPVEVYGPEESMTGICKRAIEYIEREDKEAKQQGNKA